MSTRSSSIRIGAAAAWLATLLAAAPAPAIAAGARGRDHAAAAAPARRAGETVSLDLKSADLIDVLRYFSEVSGLNLVVYPGVQGSVTVRLVDVPWERALEVVLRAHGLASVIDGNVIEVAPAADLLRRGSDEQVLAEARERSARLVTVHIAVSYAEASALAAVVEKLALSPRGTVVVDARTNSLLVTDVESRLGRARGVVRSLDR